MLFNEDKDFEHFFRSLVDYYCNRVIRFISLFVSDSLSCEELASDVFISLWTNRSTLADITDMDRYIFVIAKNKALNHLRRKQDEFVSLDALSIDVFHHSETTPESIYISKETARALNDAINQLPHRTKMAFLLVREHGKTYREAAELLSVSVKTIEKQVASAVATLKETLLKDK
jgi:RNA polymerase sigma-70 factor (ECF subfamily)